MDSSKAIKKDYSNLTMSDIMASVLKYKFVVIIFVIIGITAGIITQIMLTGDDPSVFHYANATMIVTSKNAEGSYQASGNIDNPSASDVTFAQNLVLTVTQLAKSNYVLNLVIDSIGMDYLTPDILSEVVSCKAIEKTAFIEVTITWPIENESIKIVNALMDVLPQAMIEKLDIGGVTVVDYAVKTEQVHKLNIQYIIICTAAGIMLGIAAAVVLGMLNPKVRSTEDIATYLQMNTIADIPYSNKNKDDSLLVNDPDVSIVYRESCAILSSVFQYVAAQKNVKVIYVTSTVSGEGKTTLSINLALSLASKGKNVVLIDCDTRRSAVAELLGLDINMGSLQDVLTGKAKVGDALIPYNNNLLVIRTDINETPLDTEAFEKILATLRNCNDYIIIDTPPVGLISDALLLNSCVDGVLFVIRNDYADMGTIADSVNNIKDSGANIIGCVLNAKKKLLPGHYNSKNRYYKTYYGSDKSYTKKGYASKTARYPAKKQPEKEDINGFIQKYSKVK
ncbi:MAG: tyrosine-protein kinase domain-containing protein [Eubacteriales bacterium]